ncbi:hypothetical protein X474_23990 [Dethiosulfatarculus sandiegensis]|uniref:Uncharacterized protein n=1 Tax=Dethiosulfatarculus sandiegensis TaxID=1429043 RepID=A0A0D2JPZ9_9BACT|nr:hypothetical protein X474_23990 [Dethiosulfatarculus sandiegensis]
MIHLDKGFSRGNGMIEFLVALLVNYLIIINIYYQLSERGIIWPGYFGLLFRPN